MKSLPAQSVLGTKRESHLERTAHMDILAGIISPEKGRSVPVAEAGRKQGLAHRNRQIMGPMAAVIIGGRMPSTVLDLALLPAVLARLGRLGDMGEQGCDSKQCVVSVNHAACRMGTLRFAHPTYTHHFESHPAKSESLPHNACRYTLCVMIKSFRCKETQALFHGACPRRVLSIRAQAERKAISGKEFTRQ